MISVSAVAPFYNEKDFKTQAYNAWIKLLNGKAASEREQCDACISNAEREQARAKLNDNPNHKKKGIAEAHYPWRCFHGLAYRWELPSLEIFKSEKEARLRFVEPVSISFDTFPDYARYEIIPLIWDCWPNCDDALVKWFKKHEVRTCVFTCAESFERIKKRIPSLNMLLITEGIEVEKYPEGLSLCEREIPFFLYGRSPRILWKYVKELNGIVGGNDNEFHYRLQHAKVTLALPQCDVYPERTDGQETLTQRFWEGMLSRMVMVGRAPRELTDLIGYNPVIDIDYDHFADQIRDIVAHIEDYQAMVDHNREVALRMAPWEIRMKQVMEWLKGLGYEV